jgi:hypothetical protein
MLEFILADNFEFKNENGIALITCDQNSAKRNIYLELDIYSTGFRCWPILTIDVYSKDGLARHPI